MAADLVWIPPAELEATARSWRRCSTTCSHGQGIVNRYAAGVSDLLPNLNSLLEQLTGETAGRRDARALAEAAASVCTEQELDAAMGDVIATWRRP